MDPTPGPSGLEHAHDPGREVPVLLTHSLRRSTPDTCQGTRLGQARPVLKGPPKATTHTPEKHNWPFSDALY